jgi:glycosyltransferase involved in cell wall biosynthesis
MTPLPRLSIVICTYNRADLLAMSLQSLLDQPTDPVLYELIVVDNHPTSPVTESLIRDLAAQCPEHQIHYVREPRTGLSHARNTGWRSARAAYVAYLDDDATIGEGWIDIALAVIAEHCPVAFGGPALPLFLMPKPLWYKEKYIREGYRGESPRALCKHEFVFGMNMVWRRDALESLGGFDPAFGMNGKKVAYAEETYLQMHLRRVMPDAVRWYHPDLIVHHVVRPEKLSWNWIIRQRWARGRDHFRVRYERRRKNLAVQRALPRRLAIVARTMLRGAGEVGKLSWRLTGGVLTRNRARYPYAGTYVYERGLRPVRILGQLYQKTMFTVKGS